MFLFNCCTEASKLDDIWEEFKGSLLKFVFKAGKGVKGVLLSEDGQPVVGASMKARLYFKPLSFYKNYGFGRY